MNQERVVKAGLLGLGTVGSGVYKLVERQKNEMALKAGAGLEIQKILVHNINKKREGVDQSLLTDKWEDIMTMHWHWQQSLVMQRQIRRPILKDWMQDVR